MCVPLPSRSVPATVPPCKSRGISELAAPDANCPAVSRFLSRPSVPVAVRLASHFKSVSCAKASPSVPPLSRPVSRLVSASVVIGAILPVLGPKADHAPGQDDESVLIAIDRAPD